MQLPAAERIVMAIQGPGPTIRQELRKAAEEIRAEVQREVRQNPQDAVGQIISDLRDRAEREATVQTPPVPPTEPTQVTVAPGGGGRHVFVGGTEFPFRSRDEIPPQAVDMALAFFFSMVVIIIGLPIARAFARRMDRKAGPPQIPPEVTAHLGQLSQAVDAIALEVERISEGQRYTTRLLTEQRDAAHHTLPAGSNH